MIGLALDVRNTRLNAIRDKIDSGGAAGTVCIYAGERPYTGGPAGTKLGEFKFSYPCAGDAEDATLIFDPIEGGNAIASGKAKWGRFLTSRGVFVADASVGRGEGDIQLKSVDLYEGMRVDVKSGSLSERNG